jgi:hypothetical protein
MARRFGSAMISNTDSTLLIYSTEHMRVKVYTSRGDASVNRYTPDRQAIPRSPPRPSVCYL